MQYNINREAAKLSALSSETIDKYEYLTGQEIPPPDQRRVIEQARPKIKEVKDKATNFWMCKCSLWRSRIKY